MDAPYKSIFSSDLSDRFYSAFYQRMLHIRSSNADSQFFKLLKQVLKSDPVDERVRAFIKRLLQLALNNSASFSAAALLAYDDILKEKPHIIKLRDEKARVCYFNCFSLATS
jgi:hypothetical protein